MAGVPPLDPCYAHTLSNRPTSEWEHLSDHLLEVERMTRAFADRLGAADWGGIVGFCHDLGKASNEFQAYLRCSNDRADAGEETGSPLRIDHSTFGARYLAKKFPGLAGQILAFCIAGHHAGLPNESSSEDESQRSTLRYRLDERNPINFAPEPDVQLPYLRLSLTPNSTELQGFQLAFFTRMLFSTLIDADRTCTERFCNPQQASERAVPRPALQQLCQPFFEYLNRLGQGQETPVNAQREGILRQCLDSAHATRGFFSLQVPTGGGKTLSSMAFALRHAQHHGLNRIIVAIPFTSIIEQTADVYRRAFGSLAELALVEHHSNVDPSCQTRSNQFGAEDWNAPVIVTTNVQLLESLFAARTSACRKLHRVANSVIILDEAQMLPVDLLEPTLAALGELVRNYRCSIVLCTATQPALERRPDFPIGLKDVRPVIAAPDILFRAMKRVEVHHLGPMDDAQLVNRILAESSVLCIVNTRRHAAALYSALCVTAEPNTCFHLSTLMCGAHRREAIRRIHELIPSQVCRIVSTQLIEAGVDIDLPVVYRATAGFDSIAQAAGRCNREGRNEVGITYVFESQEPVPAGLLHDGASVAQELLRLTPDIDPLAPDSLDQYFRLLYWKRRDRWDKERIMPLTYIDHARERAAFQFRDIGERYRLITDTQRPILVPFDERSQSHADNLLSGRVDFVANRELQPYLVSVHQQVLHKLEHEGVVRSHDSGVAVLIRKDAYSLEKGLLLEPLGLDPSLWAV